MEVVNVLCQDKLRVILVSLSVFTLSEQVQHLLHGPGRRVRGVLIHSRGDSVDQLITLVVVVDIPLSDMLCEEINDVVDFAYLNGAGQKPCFAHLLNMLLEHPRLSGGGISINSNMPLC